MVLLLETTIPEKKLVATCDTKREFTDCILGVLITKNSTESVLAEMERLSLQDLEKHLCKIS